MRSHPWFALLNLGGLLRTVHSPAARPARSSRRSCPLCLESLEERALLSHGPSVPVALARPITQVLVQTATPGGPAGQQITTNPISGGSGSSGGSTNGGGPGYPLPPSVAPAPMPSVCVQQDPAPIMPPSPTTAATTTTISDAEVLAAL